MLVTRWYALTVLVCVLFLAGASGPVSAQSLRVVTAGDSLTNGYTDLIEASFAAAGVDVEVTNVAFGGMTSEMFVGRAPWQGRTVNHVNEVLAADPDVILFMLGSNDAGRTTWNVSAFDTFRTSMPVALDAFASAVNGRNESPVVVMGNVIPLLNDRGPVANPRITDDFNPWIAARAQAYGFDLVDMHGLITSQPNWQDMYHSDGVHLWGQLDADSEWSRGGQYLMADAFRDQALIAVPEPCSLVLLCTGFAALALRRRRTA